MYRFANYSFDVHTGELRGAHGARRLQPKPARMLAMLVERDGELVERREIRAELWPDTNVDFDASLNTCVRQIRAAIAETGDATEYVETLPKRGYRLTVPVRHSVAVPEDVPTGGSAVSGRVLVAVSVMAMLAATAVGWQIRGASRSEATGTPIDRTREPARLAIVPFVDPLTEANATFNRDLTEAFVVALVRVAPEELVVIGPATTTELVARGASLSAVAEAVDADFVLHGGHRSEADIFFVEVVHADGQHLYAQRMQLDLSATAHAPPEVIAAMTQSVIDSAQLEEP